MSDTVVVTDDVTQVIVTDSGATVIAVAQQGVRGPQGPSGDLNFKQNFTNQSSVTVAHTLGKFPSVTVIDSSEDEVIGDVRYIDLNTLTVSFAASFSGSVLCN